MAHAQDLIIKYVQGLQYVNEIAAFKRDGHVSKNSSLYKLSPALESDKLVGGGRLKYASILSKSKHPVILPYAHKLSKLIVQEIHNSAHLGVEWTLGQLRSKFWIINASSLIKSVKRSCIVCKKLFGRPVNQRMADLPPERCQSGKPPFSYIGVDLFGPFLVKLGRSEVKRYGCIFTCFTTRAIHIEVLNNLETDTFINGFLRFCARRGYPEKVFSDNGTNLVGARTELSRSLRQLDRDQVVCAARRNEVDWHFNTPLASHQGCVWERMIRTIRKVLVALLCSCGRLTDDILCTVFCEVENIVNNRPITKCSDDVHDEPLTPNHLLPPLGYF